MDDEKNMSNTLSIKIPCTISNYAKEVIKKGFRYDEEIFGIGSLEGNSFVITTSDMYKKNEKITKNLSVFLTLATGREYKGKYSDDTERGIIRHSFFDEFAVRTGLDSIKVESRRNIEKDAEKALEEYGIMMEAYADLNGIEKSSPLWKDLKIRQKGGN